MYMCLWFSLASTFAFTQKIFDEPYKVVEIGLPGPPGKQGVEGMRGDPGRSGTPGSKGNPGKSGHAGPRGFLGSPGTKGEMGDSGKIGKTGERGPVGPTGETGLDGARGTDGMNGAHGQPGDDGIQGKQGETGPAGEAGSPGDIGPYGPSGTTGPRGPQGEIGLRGQQGTKGESGHTGDEGSSGRHGESGQTGPTGPTGPKGDTGSTGPGVQCEDIKIQNGKTVLHGKGAGCTATFSCDNGYRLLGEMLLTYSQNEWSDYIPVCFACPETVVTFGGSTYIFNCGRNNWYRAEAYCESQGGHLTSIETREENQFLKYVVTLIRTTGEATPDHWWIGLTDIQTEGSFEWNSGHPLSHTDWHQGPPSQPDNTDFHEGTTDVDCVSLGPRKSFQWIDENCGLTCQAL